MLATYERLIVALSLVSLLAAGCGDDNAQPAPSQNPDADSGQQDAADAGSDSGDEDATDAPDAQADPAAIRVEPRQLFFEDVEIGESVSATISLKNVGGSLLYVTDASVTNRSPEAGDEFKPGASWVDEDQLTIEPGTHTDIEVVYEPVDHTVDYGFVTIRSTDPDNPEVVVPIETVNAYPDIDAPATIRYGSIEVNDTAFADIAVYNRGIRPLTINDITAAGDNAISVAHSFDTPVIIPRDDYVIIETAFTPSSTDTARATVTIESDDPDEPTTEVALVGNEPTPCIRANSRSLEFGEIPTGARAQEDLVIVNCSRTRKLDISDISLTSDGGGAFEIEYAPELPATLEPTTDDGIAIVASAEQAGEATGTLVIESNDPEQSSLLIDLRATFGE